MRRQPQLPVRPPLPRPALGGLFREPRPEEGAEGRRARPGRGSGRPSQPPGQAHVQGPRGNSSSFRRWRGLPHPLTPPPPTSPSVPGIISAPFLPRAPVPSPWPGGDLLGRGKSAS